MALTFLRLEKPAIKLEVVKLRFGYYCPGITRGNSMLSS